MKNNKWITVLTLALMFIVIAVSLLAIIKEDGGAPYIFHSLRGEAVEIYGGQGLYAYNTVKYALMMRAYDWCYLFLGVPLLTAGLVLFLKKCIIGYYILISMLFFLFYNFYITSMSISYNPFFLIYIIIFVMSFLLIILLVKDISFGYIKSDIIPKLPVKTISIFVMFLAGYFLVTWLSIDFSSLLAGAIHPDLDIYTTATFNVIDLSVYIPSSIIASILLLRRKPLGAVLSVMLILGAFYTLSALSVYTVMNVIYHQQGIADMEYILVIFAAVCLAFSVISVRKLIGVRYLEA